MACIFLSHSSADEREAVALQHWLAENGWDDVFLDIDPERGLAAGDRWQEALRQAADRCEAVVFIVSPAWAKSKWCLAEFLLAKSLHKQVFGVVLKGVPIGELPIEMTSEWQLCQLTGTGPTEIIRFRHRDNDDSIAFLAEGLGRLKSGLKKAGLSADFFPWPPPGEPARSPFRGLEPLDFEDAAVFFGRDLEILRGLDVLRGLRDNPATRLFVILAASGTGKSSFLRAGLLPRLARDDRHFLPLGVVRPETTPISGDRGLVQALARTMNRLGLSGSNPGDLKARLSAGAGEFVSILQSIQEAARTRLVNSGDQSRSPAPTLVLPVDQAEELFNADAGAEARTFLSLIAAILRDAQSPAGGSSPAVSLIVAFTIRSDRYEPLQTDSELAGLQTTVFDDLKPMSATRFREVITGPVQRASTAAGRLEIKRDLVDQLVKDCATGADTLPLLGLTLERLYHDFGSDGDLRLDEYAALGGLGNIINDKIQKVLDRDPERQKQQLALLRAAFIPWLVTINPQNDQPMRRVARRSDLPAESLFLLDALAENRLLTRDQRHGEKVIEVAHEALLRQWDALAGWLQDERAALKEADALERQSREWKESGADESWLWGGQRLKDAAALAGRPDFQKPLERCADFLDRSRKQQEEREAEKARIQTEKLKAAEELAATQSELAAEQVSAREQAEKAAARARRQFKIAAALGLVALTCAVAALLFYVRASNDREAAVFQEGQAKAATIVAQAREEDARQQKTAADTATVEATKQARLAKEEEARALDLIRFMDSQVGEAFVDTVPVPLRERVSAQVDAFYTEHGALESFDEHQRMGYHIRKALVHLAAVQRYEGELMNQTAKDMYISWESDSADAALKEALRLGDNLSSQDQNKNNLGVARDRIITHYHFAMLSNQFGDAEAAAVHLRDAQALLTTLIQSGPFSAAQLVDWMGLPNLDAAVGDYAATEGDQKGARESYQKALVLQNQLVARRPADEGRKIEMQHLTATMGDLAWDGRDKAAARSWYQKAVALQSDLVALHPEDEKRKASLAELERLKTLLKEIAK